MYKLIKKISVIFTLLLLLTAGLASTSIAFSGETPHEAIPLTKKVTLYRYGPDGSIRPIRVDIELAKGQDMAEAILEECSELIDSDTVIQSYLSGNKPNISMNMFSRITSKGKGSHLKSPFSIRIPFLFLLKYGLLQELPLIYRILGPRLFPLVHCNYSNDENARTYIKTEPSPIRPDPIEITIEGKHEVWVSWFIGYTGWLGSSAGFYDKRGLTTGFDGYASFIFILYENVP